MFPRACSRSTWRAVATTVLLCVTSLAGPALGQVTTTTTLPTAEIRHCADATGDGTIMASDALMILQAAIGLAADCQAMVCDTSGGIDGITAKDALVVLHIAMGTGEPSLLRCPTAARLWMEQLLGAIRLDTPRPTVHARNLFHLSVAMWDAWVAYDDVTSAAAYLTAESPTAGEDPYADRTIAISHAAYRILRHRFAASPGRDASLASFDQAMDELGLDRSFESTAGDSPAALGNRIAGAVIAFGLGDGANEAANYADTTGYEPVNEPLYPALSGTEMNDPNRWQPLSLEFFVTQNGIPLPIDVQEFIGPHWDAVTPFALVRETPGLPYDDPGPPPFLASETDREFKDAALEVIRYSSYLDPDDPELIDISPGAHGNSPLGTNDGTGWPVNPATGQPYPPQVVKRGDWGRILAEFWADGPASETPPGHWNVVANYVADHPLFEKRIEDEGPLLDALEWDVKVYLALNGAVHDAAIAAWGAKAIYDYVRPISMIRFMAGNGQSSDPDGPSYDVLGLPLEEGLVEVITPETSAPGQRHFHLRDHLGEIAVRAWLGNPEEPELEYSGVGWILGADWVPYQRETFVTPAFAGYTSGHSTFSRAGAEVMTRVTGTPYFPGGIGEFSAPAEDFLEFEVGPSEDIRLQWATYQDAADEAGLSRLYGGIHVRADDFNGRIMGFQIGNDAYDLAKQYWDGSVGE